MTADRRAKWPDDVLKADQPHAALGGYAPGSYMCRCSNCEKEFTGDKRSFQCWPCAKKAADRAALDDRCHASRDGDCSWPECPQNRDGEPHKSGRHCPLDHWCYYCGADESKGPHECPA